MRALISVNSSNCIGINDGTPWKSRSALDYIKKKILREDLFCTENAFAFMSEYLGSNVYLLDEDMLGFALKHPEAFTEAWFIGDKKTYEILSHQFTEIWVNHIQDKTIGGEEWPAFKVRPYCEFFNNYFHVDEPAREFLEVKLGSFKKN